MSSYGVDLSLRVVHTSTVSASPSAGTETIIATLGALDSGLSFAAGVALLGFCSVTVGTSGVSLRLRVRQTNVSGTVVADTGTTTGGVAAGNLCDVSVQGFDASPASGQVYVLTLLVGSGAATSTVGFVNLTALAV